MMLNKTQAEMSLIDKIDYSKLPKHVAIIMDGNGRWAKAHQLDRIAGHIEGVNTVRKITEIASEIGIKYLTLYVFSTENWNRPQQEVDALMHLIGITIEKETPDLIKNNVHLTMIGDFKRIPHEAYSHLSQCIKDTAHCNGMTLCLALSYSSRWEITMACQRIASDAIAGHILPNKIDDTTVANHLSTADMPDPDLLIRTGGDKRISNFLLWQIAYAEIYITDTYWPDFDKDAFCQAIIEYQLRERRFGKTSDQLKQ